MSGSLKRHHKDLDLPWMALPLTWGAEPGTQSVGLGRSQDGFSSCLHSQGLWPLLQKLSSILRQSSSKIWITNQDKHWFKWGAEPRELFSHFTKSLTSSWDENGNTWDLIIYICINFPLVKLKCKIVSLNKTVKLCPLRELKMKWAKHLPQDLFLPW